MTKDFDQYVEDEFKRVKEKMNKTSIDKITVHFSLEESERAQAKADEHIKSKIKQKYIQKTLDGTHKYIVMNNLKQVIKQSPYNQKEISQKIGINERTLSAIVNNKCGTSLEIGLKLSYLLGIDMNDLFELKIID